MSVMLTHDGDESGYTATTLLWAGEGGEQVLRRIHEGRVERRRRERPKPQTWRDTKTHLRPEVYRILERMFTSWENPQPIAVTELPPED